MIDIVTYLEGRGIKCEKKGSKYFCSSPFSRDTNWSFCIYPTNTFYCWSTGVGGDLPKLVSLLEGVNYADALKLLKKDGKPFVKRVEPKEEEKYTFEFERYINKNPDEIQATVSYGQSRSISEGYYPGVYFTVHPDNADRWVRNPALMFPHVDENLNICGAKFRNIYAKNHSDRFTSRGRLGFYILDTEIPETWEKRRVWLCESETSANSLWQFLLQSGRSGITISMGGVSSIPKRLPYEYNNYEINLIIDYDGDSKLYEERLKKYEHLNANPIKLILPKGEDINSLYHQNKMWMIEHLLK